MTNIYVAASIAGKRGDFDKELLKETVSKYGSIVDPHVLSSDPSDFERIWERHEHEVGGTANIYRRDISWLNGSDFLVAHADPSFGVGYEVAHALERARIPVLLLHRHDFPSRMATRLQHPLATVRSYSRDEELVKAVDDFFYFPQQKGKIFTIEGGDGSGKATQTKLLVSRLRAEGFPAQTTYFPNDETFLGPEIRALLSGRKGGMKQIDPRAFSVLYSVNRFALKPVLDHWLRKGNNVVLDRYMEANFGHQASKLDAGQERIALIEDLVRLETEWFGLPRSDRVVYMNLPPQESLKSMQADPTRTTLDIHETAGFLYKDQVRKTFLWCAENLPSWSVVNCMDGARRLTREELSDLIFNQLRPEFVNQGDTRLQ